MRKETDLDQVVIDDPSFPNPELLYSFHRRRVEEIFLIFAWIHILQRGIWDIETRKLSRPPSKKFPGIRSIPLPSPSKHPVDSTLRTWRKT